MTATDESGQNGGAESAVAGSAVSAADQASETTRLKADEGEGGCPESAAADQDSDEGKVRMKKELGLLDGVAIILGIIIGSGIFVSPKGVIQEVKSVGLSLVVWTVCGFLSMIGALCYAELGCAIPKSGSDYAYIGEAFGPLPAFLYLWDATMVFVPTTNAIMALTVSNYLIQPFFPGVLPDYAPNLLAGAFILFFTFLNCYSIKVTTKLQGVFMFTKVAALVIVIIVGVVAFAQGKGQANFTIAFENSETSPGRIALGFYSGIYSFAGWNYLNFMTEELKNPFVNLPRAIYISLPLVTVLYISANVAYLAVMTPDDMYASSAIAVTFAERMMGGAQYLMPLLVAISALGSLSCHIMTSSRLCFVGARQGHFPDFLSLVSVDNFLPKPALVFLGVLSLLYLFVGDIYVLINYASFVESSFILLSIASLLWLRWSRPDMERPIRVTIGIPIVFLAICTFLVVMPIYVEPVQVGMGILITAIGVPVYFVGVYWRNKPNWFNKIMHACTLTSQKLFYAVKEE